MSENYWEHAIGHMQHYVNGESKRIIGTVLEKFATRSFVAYLGDKLVGNFVQVDAARDAVEAAYADAEIAAQRLAQADGVAE